MKRIEIQRTDKMEWLREGKCKCVEHCKTFDSRCKDENIFALMIFAAVVSNKMLAALRCFTETNHKVLVNHKSEIVAPILF